MDRLTNQQIAAAGLADWRKLAQALHARFLVSNYSEATEFVAAIGQLADTQDGRPEIKVTGGGVDVSLCTHDTGLWVTQPDVDLARQVSEVAHRQGLTPDPSAVTQLELALDTASQDGVAEFWSVLLTGSPDNNVYDSIFDPAARVPSLWFQITEPHATPRQRWHFDLWLAPEVAEGRITAAVAAGGTIVDDSEAPAFTVLSDRDGNRVCVCTSLSRD